MFYLKFNPELFSDDHCGYEPTEDVGIADLAYPSFNTLNECEEFISTLETAHETCLNNM